MTTESQRGGVGELPPIARDESYDRTYIPLPGGWEIQTRGKGSSFRICNTKTGERWNIMKQPYTDEMLELMGREIHAACASPVKVESGEAVSEQDLRDAVTFLREMRTVDSFHIARYPPHGRDDMPLAVDLADRIEAALSSRRAEGNNKGEGECNSAKSPAAATGKPST